jgi:hypothetical protein
VYSVLEEEEEPEGGDEEERLPGLTGTGGIYLLETNTGAAATTAPVTAAAANKPIDSDDENAYDVGGGKSANSKKTKYIAVALWTSACVST